MTSSTNILLLGYDVELLNTRGLILSKDGFHVEAVSSLGELLERLASSRFDLVVVCHTIPAVELQAALSLAAAFVPEVHLLALEALTTVCPSVSAHVHLMAGPEAFRSAVWNLVQPGNSPTHLKNRKPNMAQFEGTVKWFNNAKGYGFLGRNDGGPDVFVHYSAIQTEGYKSLKEGDPVEYDVILGDKGPQADQVRRSSVEK